MTMVNAIEKVGRSNSRVLRNSPGEAVSQQPAQIGVMLQELTQNNRQLI